VADRLPLDGRSAGPLRDGCARTTDLILGEHKLRPFLQEIRELRLRCGQQGDLTTDPEYSLARNTSRFRRVVAVLIRRDQELEACVFFVEHCLIGVSLGLLEGGAGAGEGLVVAPEPFRVEYVHLAAQALLRCSRIHGISLCIGASINHCVDVMGPENRYRIFVERDTPRKLPLESTYFGMLAAMGPRTRRSLATKRRQLEHSAHIVFVPALEPADALDAMLHLRSRAMPRRSATFYRAHYRLLCQNPEFFTMGICLPDGAWLSILSGWRRDRVTYIDLQLNDSHFKKESLSAVMRAFMLEHEIACKQRLIEFVGGTSVLLRRYWRPIESCTDIFLWRPGLRAILSKSVYPLLKRDSIYERIKKPTA
jgi:Acetyltransferase (GNAT) domain